MNIQYTIKVCAVCVTVCFGFILLWVRPYGTRIGQQSRHGQTNNGIDMLSTERSKTSSYAFVYSEEELFQTILDIRRKNCRLENNGNTGLCLSRDTCNKATVNNPSSLSTCKRRLPRGIIVGVAKAGTREVIDFLMMHPQIVIEKEPKYEISFFSDKWNRGLDWYRNEMPYSLQDQITIEKSPKYFFHSETPGRIRESIPNVKLILIIRDPVDRTISAATFRHSIPAAKRMLDQFLEERRCSIRILCSNYDDALQRYLEHFNRSQILVVDSVRFKHDPYGVLRDIETHLGLPHVIRKRDFEFNSESGFFCLRSVNKPQAVCFGQDRGRGNMSSNFEEYKPKLRRLFKSHNERFFQLIGQRFDWQ